MIQVLDIEAHTLVPTLVQTVRPPSPELIHRQNRNATVSSGLVNVYPINAQNI